MTGTVNAQNYLVPAAGTCHMYVVPGPFSATPNNINFDSLQIDSNPFCPSGVYIDNTVGTGPLTVNINQTNWNIVCPAGQSLSVQYPAPNPQAITITGLNAAGSVIFVDYPVLNSNGTGSTGGQSVQVSNPAIPYPVTATPVTGTSGNVAAAIATATMAAVVGKTNYCTGFEITGGGATAAALVTAVLSGLVTGSLSYTIAAALGAAVGNFPVEVSFVPPIPASGPNQAISLTVPSLGAGNTNSVANLHGYYM